MSRQLYLFFLLAFVNIWATTMCGRILGIFIIKSRSHHSINQPILKGLVARGHNVTIISHFKSNSSSQNYTEIVLNEGPSFVDGLTIETTRKYAGLWAHTRAANIIENDSCMYILNSEYIQRLIRSEEKMIDLMFVEMQYTQCYTLLAYKLNVPVIAIQPPSINSGVDYTIGNPFNPSYVPVLVSSFATEMNFLQRLSNTVQFAILYLYHHFVYNKNIRQIARDVLRIEYPSEGALNRRLAMAFYNNHFSFINRPMSPNAINIAGVHIEEARRLPKDIGEFIEASTHGVIFFSFGSAIKASSIDAGKISTIVQVFSSIPQRILWRVDVLNITRDVPSNVKLSTWFPQRDILEHKNVLAFISHGGLLGTLEAIHTATPVIGVPFFYDQFQNVEVLTEREMGIRLDYQSLDTDTLRNAIYQIIYNKKYRENAAKLSRVFKDKPISPLDEALFWSEYVLRYNGATHLRTQAADMALFSYLLLDIVLFVFFAIAGLVILCKFIFNMFNKTQ